MGKPLNVIPDNVQLDNAVLGIFSKPYICIVKLEK